jgi:hypothetical protein
MEMVTKNSGAGPQFLNPYPRYGEEMVALLLS